MANRSQVDHGVRLNLAMEALREFGEIRFVARGLSMLPSILPGDMIVVRKARMDEIRRGEVVLYVRNECFHAHRAIGTDGGQQLITRGDASDQADPPVGKSEFLGRVTSVVRGLKTIQLKPEQGLWIRFVQWVLQHSGVATRCLVRSHRLYARSARKWDSELARMSGNRLECV